MDGEAAVVAALQAAGGGELTHEQLVAALRNAGHYDVVARLSRLPKTQFATRVWAAPGTVPVLLYRLADAPVAAAQAVQAQRPRLLSRRRARP